MARHALQRLLLAEARTALDPTVRERAIAGAQRRVPEANLWLPLAREQLWVASGPRVEGVRAHGIYGIGLYKGLDVRLTR